MLTLYWDLWKVVDKKNELNYLEEITQVSSRTGNRIRALTQHSFNKYRKRSHHGHQDRCRKTVLHIGEASVALSSCANP